MFGARRLERFIAGLEKYVRANRTGRTRQLQATDGLSVDRCPESENAMMLAEYGCDSPRIEVVGVPPTLQDPKVLVELG